MVLWVKVFGIYPPLDLVHWFYDLPFLMQECPPFLVMADFRSVPLLEVHQVCSGGLDIGFTFFSGRPTVFPPFLQVVPQDLYLLVPMLSLLQLVRHNTLKILMEFWCGEGRTLLYPQSFLLLLC